MTLDQYYDMGSGGSLGISIYTEPAKGDVGSGGTSGDTAGAVNGNGGIYIFMFFIVFLCIFFVFVSILGIFMISTRLGIFL